MIMVFDTSSGHDNNVPLVVIAATDLDQAKNRLITHLRERERFDLLEPMLKSLGPARVAGGVITSAVQVNEQE